MSKMKIKVSQLRKIITGVIEEFHLREELVGTSRDKRISSVPPQHPKFRSNDLHEIGEEIAELLESRGYEIQKSDSMFEKSAIFDAFGSKRTFKVVVRKKQKLHIVAEDADFEVFDREDPELAAFLKGIKKNNSSKSGQSEKKNQSAGHGNGLSTTMTSPRDQLPQISDFETDDTVIGLSREKFRMSTKFEYIVEFLDKTKNSSAAFRVIRPFITNEKDDPTRDPLFKKFSYKFVHGEIEKLIIKHEKSTTKRNINSIDL
jgi:hypothetical protein